MACQIGGTAENQDGDDSHGELEERNRGPVCTQMKRFFYPFLSQYKESVYLYRSSLVVAEWDADCTSIPSSLPKIRGQQLQNMLNPKFRHILASYKCVLPLDAVHGLMKGPLALLDTHPPAGVRASEA